MDAKTSKKDYDADHKVSPVRSKFAYFDNVIHYERESCFSQLRPETSFYGFKNLVYCIMIVSMSSHILENLLRYGFSANPVSWIEYVLHDPLSRPTFTLLILLHLFPIVSVLLELCYVRYLRRHNRAIKLADGSLRFQVTDREEWIIYSVQLAMLTSMMATPVVGSRLCPCNTYLLGVLNLLYCVFGLKLYSYHQVNAWWRARKVYGQDTVPTHIKSAAAKFSPEGCQEYASKVLHQPIDQVIIYPDNLRLTNMAYFVYAPTMCYQLNFPRTRKINYLFALRCLVEIVLLVELETILYQQWILTPFRQNQFVFQNMTTGAFLLRWSKLSMGTVNMWLVMFYAAFQSSLNLSAEVLRFADRRFYDDWWNCNSIGDFWRRWNVPVHTWCLRHIYKPLRFQGYSNFSATLVVFFVSGVFHEYIASVALGGLYVHFLAAMVSQALLDVAIGSLGLSENARNIIFWLTILFGQSFLVLSYTNDVTVAMLASNNNNNTTQL